MSIIDEVLEIISDENGDYDSEGLANMVHEAMSIEASDINNCGIEAQVEYLLESFTGDQLLDELKDRYKE